MIGIEPAIDDALEEGWDWNRLKEWAVPRITVLHRGEKKNGNGTEGEDRINNGSGANNRASGGDIPLQIQAAGSNYVDGRTDRNSPGNNTPQTPPDAGPHRHARGQDDEPSAERPDGVSVGQETGDGSNAGGLDGGTDGPEDADRGNQARSRDGSELRGLSDGDFPPIEAYDDTVVSEDPEVPDGVTEGGRRPVLDWPVLSLKRAPSRIYADPGWLGYGYPTLLSGVGGIGKTLISQQWGSALSLGFSLFGEPVDPVNVLMWACEDDHDELWRRQEGISRHFKVGLEEFHGRFHVEPRHGLDNTILAMEFGQPRLTRLVDDLREQAFDLKCRVIILDNVGQMYGGNENDRHQVTLFLNGIAGALPDCAVMLLGHPAKQAGSEFSGSTAWENAVRARFYFGNKLPDSKEKERDEAAADTSVRYLAKRKSNYTDKDYRKFNFQDGVLVPETFDGFTQDIEVMAKARAMRSESAVLSGLKQLIDMGVRTMDSQNSADFLPKKLLEFNFGEGRSKEELAEAMRKLMVQGRIKKGIVGKYSNRAPKEGLVLAEMS